MIGLDGEIARAADEFAIGAETKEEVVGAFMREHLDHFEVAILAVGIDEGFHRHERTADNLLTDRIGAGDQPLLLVDQHRFEVLTQDGGFRQEGLKED